VVDFYLQLYSILHGVDHKIAFYTVRLRLLSKYSGVLIIAGQITLINAGAFPGRIIPNFLADKFGVLNVITPINFITTVLLFALFGITTAASGPIIAFAVLYGFFSGAGKSLFVLTGTVTDQYVSTLSLLTTYRRNG
jgi:hypothetical protein